MKTSQKSICIILFLQGVRCRDWSISLPEKIEALNGCCLTIHCTFDMENSFDSDLDDTAVGVWFKNNPYSSEQIVLNSSISNNLGKITGHLKDKNCTTDFYNFSSNDDAQLFFRIEGKDGLKYTYTTKYVSIHVIVKMFMGQMEVHEVLEGNGVRLRCSAITLCSSSPPTLTWRSTDRLPINDRRLQQNQTEIFSDLNFTASHLQHGVTFICNITYQLQNRNATAQSNITLRVLYAPRNTSVSVFPSNSVLEGTSVTLTCRSDANPAVLHYTWIRENGGRLEQLQTGQNLTFNVTDRTHTYYCRAGNQHGTQNTSVLLDIQSSGFNFSFVQIGVGVSMIVILCAITCVCKRRGRAFQNRKPSQNSPEGNTRSVSTNENEGESVFVKIEFLLERIHQNLHYSSITFRKHKTDPGESRRVSSLDNVYSVVTYSSVEIPKCSIDV
ncbi:B-cell receptor CD22-like isoform X2 [Triplophysa dalaica]|uniref:B-cell receptor CD22-like isoform X2 n=1 Tax=Triplophysa dalaica TaxID=1582913 RepID=UPI0024DF95E1|nr:B-cell receptor CD22-like isoform X2 [Triplophysa dalaica]